MNKNNKDSKSMKNFTISMKNMQNTNTNTNTNDEYEKYGSPRIRNIIFDMLQKNSKLVGKYERKLLIMIRSIIIRYLAWEVGKHKEDY